MSTPEKNQEETKEIRQHYDEVEFTQILIILNFEKVCMSTNFQYTDHGGSPDVKEHKN